MRFNISATALICSFCLLFASCEASFNTADITASDIENVSVESHESSSWDGPESIEVESGKGCLIFQTPENPSGMELHFVMSLEIDEASIPGTLDASQIIVFNNLPLGTYRVSCKAYKSDGSLYASGSAETEIRSGAASSVNLTLRRQRSPEAPAITSQPASLTKDQEGSSASFTFTATARASGGNLTAKWYKASSADMTGKTEVPSGNITNTPASSEADPTITLLSSSLSLTHNESGTWYYQCEFIHDDPTNFGTETSSTSTSVVYARVIPALTSFTATYNGSPVVPGSLPALSDFTITESHGESTSSGNPSDYSITTAATFTSGKVGSIPLTLKYKTSSITAEATVPYKYSPQAPSVSVSPSAPVKVAHYLGSTTLRVTATGTSYTIYGTSSVVRDDISYQWYKDNSAIAGETTSTYAPPATTPGSFTYKCRVTYTPNSSYAASTAPGYVESDSVSVEVTRWTLTVRNSSNQEQAPNSVAGDYNLNAEETYTFGLGNEDSTTANAVKSSLSWQEQTNSYLTVTTNSSRGTASVTPTATSTSRNTSLAIFCLGRTLYTIPINIVAGSTPSDAYTDWTTLKTDLEAYTNTDQPKDFVLSGDLEASSYIQINGKVRLLAAPGGATIYRASSFLGNFFCIGEDGKTPTLTLGGNGNSLTLNGHTSSDEEVIARSPFIQVTDNAVLEMNNNVTLKNNHASNYKGGAICVEDSTFNMYGGMIEGNSNTKTGNGYGGGGVYLYSNYDDCIMNMLGGKIKGNRATESGGGIYATGSKASINMSGAASVLNNHSELNVSSDGGGGGVYLRSGAKLNISSSATITGNTAASRGGGVYTTTAGTITTYSDDAISGNTANGETYGPNIYTKP